ncbi:type III secretion system needle length determinant [Aeromonas salmonicida]|uniref:type III secretion system needle length determinant n=1 Tax=Aeromonas salmonicida TaxID=645 RepID=UPI0030D850E4
MAEANQSQQQRFEQAMRLEQSLKERGHNPQPEVRHSQRVTDVHPLPQQNLHRAPSEAGKQVSLRHTTKGTQPDNKEITAKQQRQGCEQTNPQQVIFTPPNRHQSQCLTDNPERVAATDISAKERHDKPTFAAHSGAELLDTNPIAVTDNTPLVPPTIAPINAITLTLDKTRTSSQQTKHTQFTAQDNEAIPPKLASSLRTDIGELAAQLDAEIQQLTAIKPVTTGETAPKGELFANPAIWVAPLAVTPGDLQLARLAPAESNRELCQLLERLAVDIYQELGRPERPPLLRLTLPQLGDLSIRIAHHNGELQIEILATAQGELLLNQGRSDLVDRLQRLYPGERVALDLFNQADSERGSRHKRSIYEEWDADA